MADNYLEKKMEDYRRGPVSRRRLSLPRRREGEPVFVAADALSPVVAAVISGLTAEGRPVYFTARECNRREAMDLAGAAGAIFDPDADRARSRFAERYGAGHPAVAIGLTDIEADVYVGEEPAHSAHHSVSPDGLSPAETAACVVFLVSEAARALAPVALRAVKPCVDSEVRGGDA